MNPHLVGWSELHSFYIGQFSSNARTMTSVSSSWNCFLFLRSRRRKYFTFSEFYTDEYNLKHQYCVQIWANLVWVCPCPWNSSNCSWPEKFVKLQIGNFEFNPGQWLSNNQENIQTNILCWCRTECPDWPRYSIVLDFSWK